MAKRRYFVVAKRRYFVVAKRRYFVVRIQNAGEQEQSGHSYISSFLTIFHNILAFSLNLENKFPLTTNVPIVLENVAAEKLNSICTLAVYLIYTSFLILSSYK